MDRGTRTRFDPSVPRPPFEPAIEFGSRVRHLRITAGMSQEKLALTLRLDRSHVGSIERGERNVALNNVCRLAEVLSVDPSLLLQGLRSRIDESTGR